MKYLIIFFIIISVLTACIPTRLLPSAMPENHGSNLEEQIMELPFLGAAPEIENSVWLNTKDTLTLSALKGKVILLEMWTFGCVNCQNVIPFLKDWHERYSEEGLVIIGNHYPEFAYERDLDSLKNEVERLEIEYPIAQDNEGKTWRAYKNRYWPALILIDKSGNIRYTHIGEGAYEKTEKAIQVLLAEPVNFHTD